MASGKYGAISGSVARMRMMETITEHMAGVRTPAYKKGTVTFEAKLGEAASGMITKASNQSRITNEEIDFTIGDLEYTGSPLDVAINGEGFFQIQQEDGSFGYARKGNFRITPEGLLVNSYGNAVLSSEGDEIFLPHSEVNILDDGSIWDGQTPLGTIGLFRFDDLQALERNGNEIFVPKEGVEPIVHTEPQIIQRNLEASNVDMMKTMSKMTANLRAYESLQKALKIYSDMDAKAAEMGTL